jgi:putative ABC transport system permease protein
MRDWFRRFRRPSDEEFAAEIDAHLAHEADEQIERGVPPEEARYAALRRFGNVTRHLERFREASHWFRLETVWQDVRYGWRSLWRNPITTSVAVLSLALGIGANTAIYTVARGTLLDPLRLPDPDRVFFVQPDQSGAMWMPLGYQEQIAEFARAFGVAGPWIQWSWPVRFADAVSREMVLFASEGAVAALGFEPRLGRWPTDDEHLGGAPVLVLSDGVWRRYGADASMLGRQVRVSDIPFTVIGVAPPSFHGIQVGEPHAAVAPLRALETLSGSLDPQMWTSLVGRLASGQSWDAAAQQVAAWQLSPIPNAPVPTLRMKNAREALVGPLGIQRLATVFLALGALATLLLLLGSSNLAAAMLARTETRRRELAMRISLGASRGRLVRLLSIEFVILALISAAVALLCSRWMVQAFPAALLILGRNELAANVSLPAQVTTSVVMFTVAIALLTSLLFGAVPALRATHVNPVQALRAGGDGRSHRTGAQQLLLGTQIGVGCVLLVGVLLLAAAVRDALATDLGYARSGAVVFAQVALANSRDDGARNEAIRERIRERLESRGAFVAFVAGMQPFRPDHVGDRLMANGLEQPSAHGRVFAEYVEPGYRTTLGLPLVLGRDLTTRDAAPREPAVLVNETLARELWPDANPIGSTLRVRLFGYGWTPAAGAARVIGVVGDARQGLRGAAAPTLYFATRRDEMQQAAGGLYVRTDQDHRYAAAWVREAVHEAAPDEPPPLVISLDDYVAAELTPERSMLRLLGWFSAIAVLLTIVGTYGIAAQAVARRSKEIAVRLALGAPDRAIVQLITRSALVPAVAGIAAGLAAGGAAATLLRHVVFGLEPSQAAAYTGAATLLLCVALASSWWPARRALRIPPAESLRAE